MVAVIKKLQPLLSTCTGALAEPNAAFGPGTGTIHLDNVACTGSEDSLTTCVYDMDTSDCSHAQDAGVTCVIDCKFGVFLPVLSNT